MDNETNKLIHLLNQLGKPKGKLGNRKPLQPPLEDCESNKNIPG